MYKHPLKLFTHISVIFYICLPLSGLAIEYYKNNFESGTIPTYFPSVDDGQLWTLAPSLVNIYGPNNHFNISTSTAHNGSYSLRFTYEALNGICNTCGSRDVTHINAGHDGVDYFIADDGADLSIADNPATTKKDDGPKAEPGKIVYNSNGGYSKWEITSVSNELANNDRVNMKLVSKGINGESTIMGGDRMKITRHCGVDGLIGITAGENDTIRRSDCNSVILWFANVTPQLPGESIFRRVYLKPENTSPNHRQKLHYLRPDRRGLFEGEIVIFGFSADFNINPQITGLNKYGAESGSYTPGKGLPDTLKFERGIWHYIEEQYQAATLNPLFDPEYHPRSDTYDPVKYPDPDPTDPRYNMYNNDGLYRLWFSTSGNEPNQSTPTLELLNLSLPPIVGGGGTHISFWGNIQHFEHTRGSWYIDDVIVSDTFNGPVPQSTTNVFPPQPPSIN